MAWHSHDKWLQKITGAKNKKIGKKGLKAFFSMGFTSQKVKAFRGMGLS
jgi:hypothetical protein